MIFFLHTATLLLCRAWPVNAEKKKKPPVLGLTVILSDIRTYGWDDVTHRSDIFALLLAIYHFHLKC